MLVHINDKNWMTQFKPTLVDEEHKRFYYACANPLVIIRCDGFFIYELNVGEYLDALVGWDDGDHTAFVLPGSEKRRHTKITFRKRLGEKPEFSISEKLQTITAILATAPRYDQDAPKFDATKIADEVIWQIREQINRLGMRVYVGGVMPHSEESYCDLRASIADLCRIANGEVDRKKASKELVEETMILVQDVAELGAPYWAHEYIISKDWQATSLGQAWNAVRYWLESADLISLADAARILYDAADAAELNKIDRLIAHGDLTEHLNPHEPNPRRARMVRKDQAKVLLKKRAER